MNKHKAVVNLLAVLVRRRAQEAVVLGQGHPRFSAHYHLPGRAVVLRLKGLNEGRAHGHGLAAPKHAAQKEHRHFTQANANFHGKLHAFVQVHGVLLGLNRHRGLGRAPHAIFHRVLFVRRPEHDHSVARVLKNVAALRLDLAAHEGKVLEEAPKRHAHAHGRVVTRVS